MTLSELEYERLSTSNLMQLIDSKREFLKQTSDYNEIKRLKTELRELKGLLNLSQVSDELRNKNLRFSIKDNGNLIVIYSTKGNIKYYINEEKIEQNNEIKCISNIYNLFELVEL